MTATGDLPGRDPKLGVLADNGGPTETESRWSSSPAIDAGTTDGCPPGDQRGYRRPQGAACDIGAVEVTAASAPRCTTGRVVTLVLPRGIRSAHVTYDGKRARVTSHSGRLHARLVIRGLPAGHVVVRVRGRDAHGRAVHQTRTLRTC